MLRNESKCEDMFTLQLQAYMYKHRLSGALILLLDLQSGSTGKGSVVVLGETDLGAQQKNRQHLQGLQGHCWYYTLRYWLHTRWS